jgi:hypothetical protein
MGTSAVYRLEAIEDDHVRVAVVRAPGLAPGSRFRLTATAVEQMARIESPATSVAEDLLRAVGAWAS